MAARQASGGSRVASRTIYFPAQELHFAQDRPREAATAIVVNDPRLPAGPVRR